jgi:hypothetical protein
MKLYYILNNLGPRIVWTSYRGYHFEFKDGEGPFRSLAELRKHSLIFKKLQKQNPQRSQKIYAKQFLIHSVEDVITTDKVQEDLEGNLYEMLNHTLSGKLKKTEAFGVHYFHPTHHKIIELTKAPTAKGVWEARIAVKNYQTSKWIQKTKASTFFPRDWDITTLGFKIHEAFMNKKQISETKYVGVTQCGISIAFIFEKSKIVSLYPLYE